MPDFNVRTIVEALRKPERQRRLTRIEDLPAEGFELAEEHLQVVTGGSRNASSFTSNTGPYGHIYGRVDASDTDYVPNY